MSKGKRRRRGAKQSDLRSSGVRVTPPPTARSVRRRWFAAMLVAAVILAAGTAKYAARGNGRMVTLPAPREAAPVAVVRRENFVGAESCARCHAAQYTAWRSSTHGRAGGAAAPERVIAAFDGRPIHFRDAVVTPRRSALGTYEFVVARDSEEVRVLRVDGIIGGGHMEGGGTQGFVTRWNDGTYRFLPFDYSRHGHGWFCNTGSRTDHGWVPITLTLALENCGDWPPVRTLGEIERFANCQSCHASQLDATFDTTAHRYDTQYTTLAINCESCHGPGRDHIALMSDTTRRQGADIGMRALATLDKDQSLRVCFQCHAVKDRLRAGYLSGDSLERYYSLALPLLGDRPLNADGRVRTFAYQENQRYSDCYLSGGMRCTDCHDPHSQKYRDVNGLPLSGRFDDRQCTSCHGSKADPEAVTAHSHHPLQSPGSRCVSCHMPYVQHPEIGSAIRYARSDHTIPIPRPAEDDTARAVSGCAVCHQDRTASQLAAQTTSWYGAIKPRKQMIATQLRAAHDTGTPDAIGLLSFDRPDDEYSLIRAAALAQLLDRYLDGQAALVDDAVVPRLREIADRDRDVDTRSLALATLYLARGDDRVIRLLMATLLERVGAHDAPLRDRLAVILGYAGDHRVQRGDLPNAIVAYRRAVEIRPDNAALLRSLANAERDAGQLDSALAHYRQSLTSAGGDALTLVNLAMAQAAAGDTVGAVANWRRANALDPQDPLPLFNLANVALLQSRLDEAIAGYRAAAQRDESLIPASMNLARTLGAAGRYEEALQWARRARRFDPTDAAGRLLESQLIQARHTRNTR